MTGLILDAGVFIALERRQKTAIAVLEAARQESAPLATSAAVIGQVWRGHRRQAVIAIALRWKSLEVFDLTSSHGRLIGQLLGASGTTDVVDAHIVVLAQERRWPVVTSDPDDLRRLDPGLTIYPI